MALREVTFPIRFAGGVETKADEKDVPVTKLLACENAVFTRGGTLAKRYGYDALDTAVFGSATALTGGKAIARRGDELLYFTDDKLYSYQDDAAAWSEVGSVQSLSLAHAPVCKRPSAQTGADRAAQSGVAVYAWEDSEGGVYMALVDDATGRVLVSPRQLSATGTRPRCLAIGTVLHVYYAEAASGQIQVLVVDPATPDAAATATPSTLRSDLNTSEPHYDVCADAAAAKAFIAWHVGGIVLQVAFVHASGAIGSSGLGLAAPTPILMNATVKAIAVGADPDGSAYGVLWFSNSDGVNYSIVGEDLLQDSADQIEAATSPAVANLTLAFQPDDTDDGGRRFHAFWERTASDAQNRTVTRGYVDFPDISGPTVVATQRGAALASHAFADTGTGDAVYAWHVFDSTLFATYFCQRSDALVVARLLPGVAGGVTDKPFLPRVQTESRVHTHAAIYKLDLGTAEGGVFSEEGMQRVSLDFNSAQSHRVAELGRSVYIGGAGFLQLYDGRQVVEADFHYAPDDVAAPTQGAPSGDGVDVGVHLYRFTYEWPNSQGEWVIGAISAGTSVTVAGSAQKVTFDIPTCRLTAKDTVRIGVWRSEDGDTASLYRVSSLDPTATGANGYLANDTTSDAVTFEDEMSDEGLLNQDPLYTNGGILSNDPTPCGSEVAVCKRRLVFTDPSDGNLVRFSQELRDDVSAEMAPDLSVKLEAYGGSVTGLVEMDDAVIVFKEDAVYFFSGPGPLANPDAGGGFSDPVLITSDVGCTNAASIEYTPEGVIFQSRKGIYLLGRDRAVRYIGAPVEKFTDPTREAQTVVSTTLIPDRTQILLLTSSGQSLLYDYYFDQWSTFTNHTGLRAVVVGGVYHYLRSDGRVFQQNTESYQDDGSHVRMGLETAWIHLQETKQGLQLIRHVLILGNYKSDHLLRVYAQQYEYEAGWGEPFLCDPADFLSQPLYGEGLYGAGAYGDQGEVVSRYQFQIHLGYRGQAFRLRFEDEEDTADFGAAFELSELLVTGGVKRGRYNIEDARSN